MLPIADSIELYAFEASQRLKSNPRRASFSLVPKIERGERRICTATEISELA